MEINNKERILNIVDCSSAMMIGHKSPHFARFAVPISEQNPMKQFATGGMYGLLKLFNRGDVTLEQHWAFAFDRFSNKKAQSDTYKANRPKADNQYLLQSEQCELGLSRSGFNTFAIDGLEADDIIASLTKNHYNDFDLIRIFSSDRDFAQLIDIHGKVEVHGLLNNSIPITVNNFATGMFKNKYIPYNTLLLYKALVGDASDEIKGITGFGPAAFANFTDKLETEGYELTKIRDNNQEGEIIMKYFQGTQREQALMCMDLASFVQVPAIRLSEQEIDIEQFGRFISIFEMKSVATSTGAPYVAGGDPEYIAKLVHRMGEDYYSAKYGEEMNEGTIHEITIEKPKKPFMPQPAPTNIVDSLRQPFEPQAVTKSKIKSRAKASTAKINKELAQTPEQTPMQRFIERPKDYVKPAGDTVEDISENYGGIEIDLDSL